VRYIQREDESGRGKKRVEWETERVVVTVGCNSNIDDNNNNILKPTEVRTNSPRDLVTHRDV